MDPSSSLAVGSAVDIVPRGLKTSPKANQASIRLTTLHLQLLDPLCWPHLLIYLSKAAALVQVYGDGAHAGSSLSGATLSVQLRDGAGNAVTQRERYGALTLAASMQLVSDPATAAPVALQFSEADQVLVGSYVPEQPGVYSMVRLAALDSYGRLGRMVPVHGVIRIMQSFQVLATSAKAGLRKDLRMSTQSKSSRRQEPGMCRAGRVPQPACPIWSRGKGCGAVMDLLKSLESLWTHTWQCTL